VVSRKGPIHSAPNPLAKRVFDSLLQCHCQPEGRHEVQVGRAMFAGGIAHSLGGGHDQVSTLDQARAPCSGELGWVG
jgi:hypothetical protein